jgi:hypothetical protein
LRLGVIGLRYVHAACLRLVVFAREGGLARKPPQNEQVGIEAQALSYIH